MLVYEKTTIAAYGERSKEYAGLFTTHFDLESNEGSRSNKDKANNE